MAKFRINGIPQSIRDLHTVSSKSGSIATFDTDLTENLVKCIAQIQAVHSGSGTPSPTNVRSISGWQNVNVVNESNIDLAPFLKGVYEGRFAFVDLSTLSWTHTSSTGAGGGYFASNLTGRLLGAIYGHMICSKYEISSIRGYSNIPLTTDKVVFCNNNNTQPGILIIDSDYTDATTFTNAVSGVYLIYELATPTTPSITQAQFNAIINSFEAQGIQVTIALGQTIYGGYIDVISGVLTITHVLIEYDGSSDETWQKVSGTGKFYIVNTNMPSYVEAGKISNIYPFSGEASSGSSSVTVDKSFYTQTYPSQPNYNRVWIYDSDYETYSNTQFKEVLVNQPIDILLELVTPTTVQLSSNQIATILGQNNILADTGDIEVKFLETVGNKIG